MTETAQQVDEHVHVDGDEPCPACGWRMPGEPGTVVIGGVRYPVLEEARHTILAMPDGSAVVYRAGPLCERCKTCGCGEQADPFPVPAFIVAAVTGQADGMKIPGPVRALLGKVMGNNGG